MEKQNFKIAVEAEYIDGMKREVEKLIDEKCPDYMRNKILIIEMVDMK